MEPNNRAKLDIHELIDRIVASDRLQSSSHFSDRVYSDEPIITTGRQMANYLPDRYREMKAISRWEKTADGRERWLSEGELFYRQGKFMEDFEDDFPYHNLYSSCYFPTYDALSDRQLRGYFTWRAAVRKGNIEQTCPSFAYLYLYELISGIGVSSAQDGFQKMKAFQEAYAGVSTQLDRDLDLWLQDYVVYNGLPASLLGENKTLEFDKALGILVRAENDMLERLSTADKPRRKKGVSALPLPCDSALEEELFGALDTISSYRLTGSRLYKTQPDALRHVCCSVYVRMSEYRLKQRTYSLTQSMYGGLFAMPYNMFSRAIHYHPDRHADVVYELDEVHRYRCEMGMWTCERFQGNLTRNPKLGITMRATDRILREKLDFGHPLKPQGRVPKYQLGFIEEEVDAWITWSAAHAPRRIDIDLSQLAGIRRAAAATRESLLIDEEREGTGSLLDAADGCDQDVSENLSTTGNVPALQPVDEPSVIEAAPPILGQGKMTPAEGIDDHSENGLPPHQVEFLLALLHGERATAASIASASGSSEDLLVDSINEALFDLVGDTVIEYGADGPELIEDYREDVEGFLNHE